MVPFRVTDHGTKEIFFRFRVWFGLSLEKHLHCIRFNNFLMTGFFLFILSIYFLVCMCVCNKCYPDFLNDMSDELR